MLKAGKIVGFEKEGGQERTRWACGTMISETGAGNNIEIYLSINHLL